MTELVDVVPEPLVEQQPPFVLKMVETVVSDFEASKRYLQRFHDKCAEMDGLYHNAQKYESLKKDSLFPMPLMQEAVDQLTADIRDKLFYSNRPATVVPLSDADQGDADAKQAMIAYQDYKDGIFEKMGLFIKDASLKRCCVSQVDYCEETIPRWVEVDVTAPAVDEFGQPMVDPASGMPMVDELGQPAQVPTGEKKWQKIDQIIFKGAKVKRVDPRNLFFSQDKQAVEDEWPIMVRSKESLHHFMSKPYYINQAELIQAQKEGVTNKGVSADIENRLLDPDKNEYDSKKEFEYIEWQGMVNQIELFTHLGYPEDQIATIKPYARCHAIIGVVNQKTMVRCEYDPVQIGRPNIIIGVMNAEGESLFGNGLATKIEAIVKGSEVLLGILLENFKQSVNAMWVINKNAIIDGKTYINKAGTMFETLGNPKDVIQRVEQPAVAKDIYLLLDMFKQMSQDASGQQEITKGQGDPAAATFGEANIVAQTASLRMRDYLKTFEVTFIQPLYQMRNQIDANFIDTEYAYSVIGESGLEWVQIDPAQIRAGVDFICEASTRETNRAVLVQQILQLIQLAPVAMQMGQPIRIDKMIQQLCETGFSWSRQKTEEILPLLKVERQGLVDIDAMLVQNAMLGMAMQTVQGVMGVTGQVPQGKSETDTNQSLQKRGQPQVGALNP